VFSTSNLDRAGTFLGNNFSPSFFFGSEEGNVFFADDLGHSAQVQSLSSCVDELLFYDDKRRLIILTRSLLLVQLQVDDDGRVVPVQKVKLSVAGGAGERGIRQVIWAGPGIIAAATGESVVCIDSCSLCFSLLFMFPF
jgi:intraflagellar transport protein 140